MITIKEVRAAVTGVVELARGEITGLIYFDGSVRSFWRSFWAAVIVVPAWLLLLALDEQEMTAGPLRMIVVQTIDYTLLWTAFPLLLHEILARRGHTQRFCLYISIRNWASVIETPAMLFAAAFAAAVPGQAAQLVPFAAMIGIFAYECFLARVGLAIGIGAAIAVAATDFVLSMILQLTADYLLGVGALVDAAIGSSS
jgi:hypothetical protein